MLAVYGDFLYLRPRNADVEYAVPINGPIETSATPLQEGSTATVNPQFDYGFRFGFARAFDQCSTISASYTHYENTADDSIAVDPPFVIRSMVVIRPPWTRMRIGTQPAPTRPSTSIWWTSTIGTSSCATTATPSTT